MLPRTGWLGCVLPTSTRMRNARAMRKKNDVRRAKMRRVRVAALTLDSERATESSCAGTEAFCALRGRRIEVKVGSVMICCCLELPVSRERRLARHYVAVWGS